MAEVSNSTRTYDYSSVGSYGSDATKSVNGERLNQQRALEEKSKIDPLTTKIENKAKETEKINEIKTKVTEFQDIVKFFDIYNDENVFNQHHFKTSGDAAVYDSVNNANLENGKTSITVQQLAQKDVSQSIKITSNPESSKPSGDLMIKLGSNILFGKDTTGDGNLDSPLDISSFTYKQLAVEINKKEGLSSSVEKVGDNEYRLIIKSTDTGMSNTLSINSTSAELGFVNVQTQNSNTSPANSATDLVGAGELNVNGNKITLTSTTTYDELATMISGIDGVTATVSNGNPLQISMDDGTTQLHINQTGVDLGYQSSKTQFAQNLKANIDGVNYDSSSNSITTQESLKITAVEIGTSTIDISTDTGAVKVAAQSMATKYNELVTMINKEIDDKDSVIENPGTLKTILSDIKNMLFKNYGGIPAEFGAITTDKDNDDYYTHANVTNNKHNIFLFGFELDKSGKLEVDTKVLDKIINGEDENYKFEDLKNVFTGAAENKGLGVQLEEYLDALDGFNGLFSNYETKMITDTEDLEKEKTDELKKLDSKYSALAQQFAAYSSLISQMESSFSGLSMMIKQSTSS